MNLSRCFDCAVGIIPVCHGRAEYAHDVVPDMALDRAAIAGNCMIHGLEYVAQARLVQPGKTYPKIFCLPPTSIGKANIG